MSELTDGNQGPQKRARLKRRHVPIGKRPPKKKGPAKTGSHAPIRKRPYK